MQLIHLGLGRNLGGFPVGLGSRTCLTSLSLGILDTWLNWRTAVVFSHLEVVWHSGPGLWSRSRGVGRILNQRSWSRRNSNDSNSDSGQTFCSPIVIVCATNMRKRHTWQFKQLDASTRDDHGYSARRQRTNLHTYTQGPFQISSVHGLITQPTLCECNRSELVSLKFPFAHSGWHYRCSVTLATQQWMRVLMGARPLLRKARHRIMITPVNPPRLRLIHISPRYQTVYRSFEIMLEWVLSIGLEFKSNVLCKPIASKKHSI